MKVLYIYSCGEYPARKTVSSFIYSFEKHSDHQIIYHNLSFCPLLPWYDKIQFDLIIYSHFITTPWNRARFLIKIEKLKKLNHQNCPKIAFFQDEYFNTDLTSKFIDELNVAEIYSVAPESEWVKLYKNAMSKEIPIRPYLTGYVDDEDIVPNKSLSNRVNRPIDIGYRIGWPSSKIFRLGAFGYQKFDVAQKVLDHAPDDLKIDIKMGESTYTGKRWYDFLSKCRFTIGSESGASLLDHDGSINKCIENYCHHNPSASFKDAETKCFPDRDGNLNLRAISPRIFEAALLKTGLILIEGDYNGILKPGVHYLPIKNDFSNLVEIIDKSRDEKLRLAMVENTYNDLILSEEYRYSTFVKSFFDQSIGTKETITSKPKLLKRVNQATETLTWLGAGIYCRARF